VHRVEHRLVRMRDAFPVVVRGACAEAVPVCYDTRARCPDVMRQLTKVGRGLRERRCVPQLVLTP
jgi:hypothetical protein